MCMHVLCLSQKGPPLLFPSFGSKIKMVSCFPISTSRKLELSCVRLYSCSSSSATRIGASKDTLERIIMHNPSIVKQKIFKKWMTGLQRCSSSRENLSISERRRIIKLSADLALASVRNGSRRWSRAIIDDASRSPDNKGLAQQILGLDSDYSVGREENLDRNGSGQMTKRVFTSSKKIVKRSRRVRRSNGRAPRNEAASIAKRLVKKRTELLKDFVPGGRDMDDVSLIEETLDYMVWLQAQVDVMRALARSLLTS